MAMSKWLVNITVMLVAAAIRCGRDSGIRHLDLLPAFWGLDGTLPPAGMVAAGTKP